MKHKEAMRCREHRLMKAKTSLLNWIAVCTEINRTRREKWVLFILNLKKLSMVSDKTTIGK